MPNRLSRDPAGTTSKPSPSSENGSAEPQFVIVGIAAYFSAKGDPVEFFTTGVFQPPKASIAVLTFGARVAWDSTAKAVTAPAIGRFPVGVAMAGRRKRCHQRRRAAGRHGVGGGVG